MFMVIHISSSLKKYQAERKLDKLLHSLKTILDTPVKLDLLKEIRGFIPPHQVNMKLGAGGKKMSCTIRPILLETALKYQSN